MRNNNNNMTLNTPRLSPSFLDATLYNQVRRVPTTSPSPPPPLSSSKYITAESQPFLSLNTFKILVSVTVPTQACGLCMHLHPPPPPLPQEELLHEAQLYPLKIGTTKLACSLFPNENFATRVQSQSKNRQCKNYTIYMSTC